MQPSESQQSTFRLCLVSLAVASLILLVESAHSFVLRPTTVRLSRSKCMRRQTESKPNAFQASIKRSDGSSSQMTTSKEIVPGIGEEGCKLPSPSRVNVMDDNIQVTVFLGILLALGVCTSAFNDLLTNWTVHYEWFQSFRYSWPITLGLVFVAAGVTHFTLADEYRNIYPYYGAWGGLWKLPGSAEFHVAWTGVVEFLGGIGLLAGGLIDWLAPSLDLSAYTIATPARLESGCAAALYILTWAVTPANIYMFTHGARLPMQGGEVPISFHVGRFFLQVVLLGFLYQLGKGSFDALLS